MRAIIFDFDGTIADSLVTVIKVFEDLTRRPKRFTEAEIEMLQHKDLLQIALELNIPKWKIPWLIVRGRRMFRTHMRSVKVHPGMPEILRKLQSENVPLYVVSSNSRENVRRYLRWHKLEDCFTEIYGGAGLLGKARSLFRMFKREGIDPLESWYVGDETRDIIAAHAAGLQVISVSWGYNSRQALLDHMPEILVDTPEQLTEALEVVWKK